MHPSNKVTLENVKDVVRYHRPTADQSRRHEALSLATEHFITALLENCPDCADRSAAVRHARDAKMTASAAIALEDEHEPAAELGVTTGNATMSPLATNEPPSAPQPAPRQEPPPSDVASARPSFSVSGSAPAGDSPK